MLSPLVIRPAVHSDIEALTASLQPEVSMAQLANRWNEHVSGHRTLLVAVSSGAVTGTVSTGEVRKGLLRLFALDVGRDCRRQGIGAALVRAVESVARSRRFNGVFLEVAIENSGAIRLYDQLGYRRQGELFIQKWMRLNEGHAAEQVEEQAQIMVKQF
jgi:ribosomal protein S18 acetylase RimI-like enzyme